MRILAHPYPISPSLSALSLSNNIGDPDSIPIAPSYFWWFLQPVLPSISVLFPMSVFNMAGTKSA